MKILTWTTIFTVVLTVVLAGNAGADILVQESFKTTEYTVDTDLVGQNGGSGFTGNWTSSDAFAAHVRYEPRSAGLSYPGWPDAGGSVEHFRNDGEVHTKRVAHATSYSAPTISGTDVAYFGFLFNSDDRFEVQWVGGGSRENRFIYAPDSEEIVFLGGGSLAPSSREIRLDAEVNKTHLILLRISDNTTHTFEAFYDNIEAWVDPADLSNLGLADGTALGIFSKFNGNNNDLTADELALTASLESGESFRVDEFFFTDDLASIPEPATGLILLGGGLALLVRRRCRR